MAERTASAAKIGKGVAKHGPKHSNPPSNSKVQGGGVPKTFYENSRSIDTDRAGK